MGRWEPDASGRLQQAAIELFHEQGYEQTTLEQISHRAGLTTRTYFRHFADKREVLFSGEDALHELLVLAVTGAAGCTTPIDALAAGLKPAMTVYFQRRSREAALKRHQVIAANAALQERESLKLSRLATSVARALSERGVAEPTATLTAETGVMLFKVAVERWLTDTAGRDPSYHVDALVAHLRALIGTA